MKCAFALLALTLVSTSAFAAAAKGIRCKEVDTGANDGYVAFVTNNLSKAELGSLTGEGVDPIATLSCVLPKRGPGGPNSGIKPLAFCSQKDGATDAAFILRLRKDIGSGLISASLGRNSSSGILPVAELECQKR